MKTHADLIPDLDAARRVQEVTGAPLHTVRSWGQRGSIPVQYWPALVAAELTSLEQLAMTAPARKPSPDLAKGQAA